MLKVWEPTENDEKRLEEGFQEAHGCKTGSKVNASKNVKCYSKLIQCVVHEMVKTV